MNLDANVNYGVGYDNAFWDGSAAKTRTRSTG
jgi:Zn-dependent metalloprotease